MVNPGGGACVRCGEVGCETNDAGVCKVCAMWREPASCNHKSDGAEQSASRASLRPKPEPEPVELESPPEPYTTEPGCQLNTDQDVKVLEIALANKTGTRPHVASMNKTDDNLQGTCVHIPLRLVRHHFIEEKTTDTIQLEAPDKVLYSVGASKHSDDLVVIKAAWNSFVAKLRIEESDALIFRSKENSRHLQVLIIDCSGREKGMCDEDNLLMFDPPPPEVVDMSSSNDDDSSDDDDDDDMPREGMGQSSMAQKRVTRSCAAQSSGVKTRKMAATSSPRYNSGYGAPDQAGVRLEAVSEPPSNNLGCSFRGRYIKACWRFQSPQLQKKMQKKVEEKVQEIGSEFPILARVMTSSNVGGTFCVMPICNEYSTVACLPNKTQPMVLQMEGKEELWDATLSVNSTQGRQIFWRKFPRENRLKAGDICLFELMAGCDTGKLTMKVYVIHKT